MVKLDIENACVWSLNAKIWCFKHWCFRDYEIDKVMFLGLQIFNLFGVFIYFGRIKLRPENGGSPLVLK